MSCHATFSWQAGVPSQTELRTGKTDRVLAAVQTNGNPPILGVARNSANSILSPFLHPVLFCPRCAKFPQPRQDFTITTILASQAHTAKTYSPNTSSALKRALPKMDTGTRRVVQRFRGSEEPVPNSYLPRKYSSEPRELFEF